MRNRTRSAMAVAAVTIAAGAGLAGLAGPAHAAQTTLPITCDNGEQLTVRVNTNNSSEHGGWGVGQVVAGGTGNLVPTEISGSLVDNVIHLETVCFLIVPGVMLDFSYDALRLDADYICHRDLPHADLR